MTAPQAPTVQMFGLADSRVTQSAVRFFKERRASVTFVDLRRKPIAPGELRRFVERLLANNGLLRLPLVRFGNAFTAGTAEQTWKAWLTGATA